MKASLGSAQISHSDVALGAGLSPVAAREQGQMRGEVNMGLQSAGWILSLEFDILFLMDLGGQF